VEELYKSFGQTAVLKGFSLSIQPQEVAVLVGPSGSGKSTLLRCINLLDPPNAGPDLVGTGRITAAGVNPDRIRQRIGMVFQDFNLFTHLTALGNVMVGLTRGAQNAQEGSPRTGPFRAGKGWIGRPAGHYPAQLSGGQKQRVAIARASGMDPHLMLFGSRPLPWILELTGEAARSDAAAGKRRNGRGRRLARNGLCPARSPAAWSFWRVGSWSEQGPPAPMFERPAQERTRVFFREIADLDERSR
jgi:polar amino acid transport system ATP-binding protein